MILAIPAQKELTGGSLRYTEVITVTPDTCEEWEYLCLRRVECVCVCVWCVVCACACACVRACVCAQYLEEEYKKGARDDDPMPPVQPYHYGSHYSNSGTVLHFMVR